MGLGDDEVGRDKGNPLRDCLAEQTIGLSVMLIALAAQRDPRPAIDE